ncbi:hypothetical protein [Modestobacter versicolor]|uniref:Uncharacterized protein n=1 Tax=Modestobacter versicolor TaxID=429133 RepID=A0A323VEJ5_9ACTN|nr:hypothetical protein [Modestobacter versicolor]MBB3677651.1 hypothetical protein [Modestobacter versicolor]PZA22483.1 hypothetical protein DMO24_04800 [Modestobacter versicolor]
MRRRTLATTFAVLVGTTACSGEPEDRTAAGVPERWYTAVEEALADEPGIGSTALVESGGPCPLRDEVTLAGEEVSDVSGHGVVRLGGDVPAVLCEWYEETPVQVVVAQAPDDDLFAELVEGTGAVEQRGNEQTEQEVEVDGRTVVVVRTVFPTNPAAGTRFTAALLDEDARGLVQLEVDSADELDGYDERSAAEDLVAFLDG